MCVRTLFSSERRFVCKARCQEENVVSRSHRYKFTTLVLTRRFCASLLLPRITGQERKRNIKAVRKARSRLGCERPIRRSSVTFF